MMGFLEAIGLHPAPDTTPAPAVVGLPGGKRPLDWIEEADQDKPTGYATHISTALAHYRGQAGADTRSVLARMFPETAQLMEPLSLGLFRKVVDERSRVFDGEPCFDLVIDKKEGGEPTTEEVEAAGPLTWDEVLRRCNFRAKLVQCNRLAGAVQRAGLRIVADADGRVRLTVFSPDAIHVRWAGPDSRDLDASGGIMLDAAPIWRDGKPVKRWEFWSAGENPQNFCIDERGKVYPTRQPDGTESTANPYKRDDGKVFIPLVLFTCVDSDLGFWQLPEGNLLDAERNLDAAWTALLHLVRMQGFAQPISERDAGAPDHKWPEKTVFGPERILQVPEGHRLRFEHIQAPVETSVAVTRELLRHVAIMHSLPPASVTTDDAARAVSGIALQVERAALNEVRADQIDLFREPTEQAIEMLRLVHNAGQTDNSTRFVGCRPRFTPDDPSPPTDPLVREQVRAARQKNGLTSPAREIADERELDEATALEEATAIKAENDALSGNAGALGRLLTNLGPADDEADKPAAKMPPEMQANADKMKRKAEGAPAGE